MSQEEIQFIRWGLAIITLIAIVGFIAAMIHQEVKDAGETKVADQYRWYGSQIVIEVPQNYDAGASTTKLIQWTGSNGQKWNIIWHMNNETINLEYAKSQREAKYNYSELSTLVKDQTSSLSNEDQAYREMTLGMEHFQDYCPYNQTAWCIMEMVQLGVPYVSDPTSTGQEEYWKYPSETLRDGGDCEDKAALLAVLYKQNGYNVSLAEFTDADSSKNSGHGHAAVLLDARQVPLTDNIYRGYLYQSPVTKRPEILIESTDLTRPNDWDSVEVKYHSRVGYEINVPERKQWQITTWPQLPFNESAASISNNDKSSQSFPISEATRLTATITPTTLSTTQTNEIMGPKTEESCTSLISNRAQDMEFWNYVENNNILPKIQEQTQTCHLKTASEANGLLQNSPDPGSRTMNGIKGILIDACVPCQDPNSAQPGRTREIVNYFNTLSSAYNQDYQYCKNAMGIRDY